MISVSGTLNNCLEQEYKPANACIIKPDFLQIR
jgi:hypothetical protein